MCWIRRAMGEIRWFWHASTYARFIDHRMPVHSTPAWQDDQRSLPSEVFHVPESRVPALETDEDMCTWPQSLPSPSTDSLMNAAPLLVQYLRHGKLT